MCIILGSHLVKIFIWMRNIELRIPVGLGVKVFMSSPRYLLRGLILASETYAGPLSSICWLGTSTRWIVRSGYLHSLES